MLTIDTNEIPIEKEREIVWTNSVFIPLLRISEQQLRQFFSNWAVIISHIDYNIHNGNTRAFVHFSSWDDTDLDTYHLKKSIMQSKNGAAFTINDSYVLRLVVNFRPIQTTELSLEDISSKNAEITTQIQQLINTTGVHDVQLNTLSIYVQNMEKQIALLRASMAPMEFIKESH